MAKIDGSSAANMQGGGGYIGLLVYMGLRVWGRVKCKAKAQSINPAMGIWALLFQQLGEDVLPLGTSQLTEFLDRLLGIEDCLGFREGVITGFRVKGLGAVTGLLNSPPIPSQIPWCRCKLGV